MRSRIVREVKIVNLSSTSKQMLNAIGIFLLTVTVGSEATRTIFVVVIELGADVILRYQYIDTAVDEINVKKRALVLRAARESVNTKALYPGTKYCTAI